jgi:hypothetical protein
MQDNLCFYNPVPKKGQKKMLLPVDLELCRFCSTSEVQLTVSAGKSGRQHIRRSKTGHSFQSVTLIIRARSSHNGRTISAYRLQSGVTKTWLLERPRFVNQSGLMRANWRGCMACTGGACSTSHFRHSKQTLP